MNIRDILRESVKNVLSEAKENYQQKANQLRKRGFNLDEATFDFCVESDPTSANGTAGKYFDWILANSQQNRNPNLKDILSLFERKKQLLAKNGKSINIQDYNPDTLVNTIESVCGTSLEWENALRKFGDDVQVVYKDSRYIVVHCNTWEAERFFGRKTNWCTVGNEDYYNKYNSFNLLFICIPIEDGKPNIDSRYKMQFDYSNGPNGTGEPQFHCANASDRVFSSFEDYYKSKMRRWQYDKPMIQYLAGICEQFKVPTAYEEGGDMPEGETDELRAAVTDWYREECSDMDVYIEEEGGSYYGRPVAVYEMSNGSTVVVYDDYEDMEEAAVEYQIETMEQLWYDSDFILSQLKDYIHEDFLNQLADSYAEYMTENKRDEFCLNSDSETEDEMRDRLESEGMDTEDIEQMIANENFIYDDGGLTEEEYYQERKDNYQEEYLDEDLDNLEAETIVANADLRDWAEDTVRYDDAGQIIGDYSGELENGMYAIAR